jgi:hypothetical protein
MALGKTSFRVTAISGLLLLTACAAKPSYSTYEDCILSNIKANQSGEAVVAIRQACRGKFPEPRPTQTEIELARRAANAAAQSADADKDAAQQAADAAMQAADAAAGRQSQ